MKRKSDRRNIKGIKDIQEIHVQEIQKTEPGGAASLSVRQEYHGKTMTEIPEPGLDQVRESTPVQAQKQPKEHKWGKDPARHASAMSRSLRLLRPGVTGSRAFQKRRKQLHLLVTLLRLAVRLLNAFDKKTVYRK